jgi:ankyrin repeat protein
MVRRNAAIWAVIAVALAPAAAAAQSGSAPATTAAFTAAVNSVVQVIARRPDGSTDSGTGFVARSLPTGQLVLTAYHVVRGASGVRLTGGNLQLPSITARVAAYDESTDVAVLMVPGTVIAHPLRLGDAMSVSPGQELYVLGFPRPETFLGDIRATFTRGIVSAVRLGLIQMQAPISSGNSGGPVLTQRGEVVGLVTGVLPDAKGAVTEQLNFATWINSALPLLDTVRTTSRPSEDHALALAAGSGDPAVCGQASTAKVNIRDDLGDLPLVQAARGAHGAIVACLLKQGADPNAAEADGTTPLLAVARAPGTCPQPARAAAMACLAAFRQSALQVAQTLLAAGSLVDSQDAAGATPLEYAVLGGNTALAELLLQAHANPILRDRVHGATVLMYAAQLGNEPVVAHLAAAAGSAINFQDSDGRSALDYAVCGRSDTGRPCLGGDLPTIRALLAVGASAAVRDRGGQTPMWYAARALVTKLDLMEGARPSEVSTLLNAAAHGELSKVRALVVCGAAVACAHIPDGLPPLEQAPPPVRWYISVAALLETHGASLWPGGRGDSMRLMEAVWDGRLDAIQHFAGGPGVLDAQDAEGWSALAAAAWRGGRDDEIVQALLARHADPGVANDLGRTPLMYAAARGDLSVVEMLLNAGASPVTPDFEGHNAAWYAICYPHVRTAEAAGVLAALHLPAPACSSSGGGT